MEQEFVKALSPESRYMRFMNTIREVSPAQLIRLTQIDYDREMAFVATIDEMARRRKSASSAMPPIPDGESCEFAIVVADDWQGKGLARRLMGTLIDTARGSGNLSYMHGDFLAENSRMLAFVASLGFVLSAHPEDHGLKRGVLVLNCRNATGVDGAQQIPGCRSDALVPKSRNRCITLPGTCAAVRAYGAQEGSRPLRKSIVRLHIQFYGFPRARILPCRSI
jgi:GNAT superfamily N-acetyltransferase